VIFDTNGFSALAEGDSGLKSVLRDASQLAIPVIVLGKNKYMCSASSRREDVCPCGYHAEKMAGGGSEL